jgi:hypothetical protein
VRRDHLDDLTFVGARQGLEELRGAKVLGFSLAARECLVSDMSNDVLQKCVLATFG